MGFTKYLLEDITSIKAGGDRPSVCLSVRTKETPVPVFSNGIENEGLYGFTNNSKIEGDSLTISARGVNVGTVCYRSEPFVPIVRLLSIIPNRDIVDAKYLYYLLKNTQLSGTGSAQPQITVPMIKKQEIVIHEEMAVQKKISGFLSSIDQQIVTNTKINENLLQQAGIVFKKFYDESPNQQPFTSLIDVLGGGTPKTGNPDFWNGPIPFFTPKDVGAPYAFKTEKYITESGLAHCNSHLYQKDTTFVTARGTVGKVSLAGFPMAMNQSCYALVSETIDPLLVYFYVLKVVASLKHKASGAVFDAIVTRDFESEILNVLSDDDSKMVLAIIRPMMDEIHNNSEANMQLASLRDSLLPRLMSGDLDVSDIEL